MSFRARSARNLFFLVLLFPLILNASPIYFPEGKKVTGLLDLDTGFFSIGAELKTGFLAPEGDLDLEFFRGDPSISHTNEKRGKFRIDRLMLIPQLNIQEIIKAYAELEATTQRDQTNSTFFREGHLSFYFPYHFFMKVGLEDRFISPEFMAVNSSRGDNKKLTEVYPINGTAFWEDEDLGLTFGGDHPVTEGSTLYWRGSVTNGLSLQHDELTRNQIYPIFHDDRHSQNLNIDLSDNKEAGMGFGFKHAFSRPISVDILGFFFNKSLNMQDVTFLTTVIPGYSSINRTSYRTGVNNEMNVSDFNLFTQYIYAVDGAVKRDGFYIQPSYVIGLNSESAFFNSIRLLYRFNTLDVRANDVSDNLPTSPFTWDRQTHSVAVNLQIHSYVLFRNEYHFNLEATGADRNKVSNNEFLSQLEVRF